MRRIIHADLMEQVADAHKIINRLKKSVNIDTTKIGVLGYSWGGLAASLVAMQRHDIATVVSFDGSEFHRYGYTKSEDDEFDETVNTPFFKNSALYVPYLRLESNPQPSKTKKDSTYNFLQKVSAAKQVIKIDSASIRTSHPYRPPSVLRVNVPHQTPIEGFAP